VLNPDQSRPHSEEDLKEQQRLALLRVAEQVRALSRSYFHPQCFCQEANLLEEEAKALEAENAALLKSIGEEEVEQMDAEEQRMAELLDRLEMLRQQMENLQAGNEEELEEQREELIEQQKQIKEEMEQFLRKKGLVGKTTTKCKDPITVPQIGKLGLGRKQKAVQSRRRKSGI
jgi:hypothetical protein